MMISLTRLSNQTARPFEKMTFPHYRHALTQLDEDLSVIALGYSIANNPVGLLLASASSSKQEPTAQGHSLFVSSRYQNQGIGTKLVKAWELELDASITELRFDYAINRPHTASFEKVLINNGWKTGQVGLVKCLVQPENLNLMVQADWMNKNYLSSEFTILPWHQLHESKTEELRQHPHILAAQEEGLSPFMSDRTYDATNSLTLLHDGQVIGWVLVYWSNPHTLMYDCLFVLPKFRTLGRAAALLAESIKKHWEDYPNAQGMWQAKTDNAPMVAFVTKRLRPFVNSLVETRNATKTRGG